MPSWLVVVVWVGILFVSSSRRRMRGTVLLLI